jgi:hypothetical protein
MRALTLTYGRPFSKVCNENGDAVMSAFAAKNEGFVR